MTKEEIRKQLSNALSKLQDAKDTLADLRGEIYRVYDVLETIELDDSLDLDEEKS